MKEGVFLRKMFFNTNYTSWKSIFRSMLIIKKLNFFIYEKLKNKVIEVKFIENFVDIKIIIS